VVSPGSTVPRRQLGRKLRELRESRQLTVHEAVSTLEWSKPRLWRYETGQVPMHPNDVETMCRLYGADPGLTDALKELARETKAKGWWHSYGADLSEWFELYIGLEAAASRLRHYEAEIIPGLVQSPKYMRAIIRNGLTAEHTTEIVEQRVAIRQQRQRILTRSRPRAPELDIILSEAALLRGFDRAVMIEQFLGLRAFADRPNISIRILPLSAGPHRAFHGPFVILDFPRPSTARDPEPTTVYQEGPTGALYLDKPAEARVYDAIWADLESKCWDRERSAQFIRETAEEKQRGGAHHE
jgi:transcriptional regulator with XRE-family HTH domain